MYLFSSGAELLWRPEGSTVTLFHLALLCSVQTCICFCEDSFFSTDWQMRWPCWSLQMAVWPLRCFSPRYSFSLSLSPSWGGPLPACSYLFQWRTLTEKGTWLLAGGRGGGGSNRNLEVIFLPHLERPQSCAICFVSEKSASFSPPIRLAALLLNPKCSEQDYGALHLSSHPQGGTCWLYDLSWYFVNSAKQLLKITKQWRMAEEELWSLLLQKVNNMLAICIRRGRKKERRRSKRRESRPLANGESNLPVMKAWFMASDCLLLLSLCSGHVITA